MIGQTIFHYCITDKLGQDGMGEVHRATDSKLACDVRCSERHRIER